MTRTELPTGFTDYPLEVHQKDYGPARDYLAQRASDIPGLVGLYEHGSVAAPGISDIDLIAVIDNHVDRLEILWFLEGSNAPAHVTRVLDQGTIKPVSQPLFERINILGEINARAIFPADAAPPSKLPEQQKLFVDVANVVDWLPERILMLRSLLSRPTLSCRRVLGGLGSFRHSTSAVSRVLGYEPAESIEFSNAYDDLRANWFDQPESSNFQATVSLINSGVTSGRHLIETVTSRLLELGIFGENETIEGSTFWLNSSKAFTFGGSDAFNSFPDESAVLLIQSIPASWMSVFTTYSLGAGKISTLITENLELPPGYSPDLEKTEFGTVLAERIQWINESFDFLDSMSLSHLMYRFSHLRLR